MSYEYGLCLLEWLRVQYEYRIIPGQGVILKGGLRMGQLLSDSYIPVPVRY